MEDILASIRRILDEDPPVDAAAAAAPVPEPPPTGIETPSEPGDELLLDGSMLIDAPPLAPPRATVAPPPPVLKGAEMVHPPSEIDPAKPVPGDGTLPPRDGLLGPAAADETASSVQNLVRAVTSDRVATIHRDGPTIEDLVRQELRPLLKSWLDSHLPPLVERLVRSEIERVMNRAAL